MKAVLIGFLQIIIISGILYGYYHFFLRNKKFHQYNRYYLLIAVLLSIGIPFLKIPLYFTKEQIEPSLLLQALTSSSTASFEENAGTPIIVAAESWFTAGRIAFLFYALIVTVIFIRLLIALIKIYRLADNYPVERMNGIRFVNTEEPGTPFSFFRWLFWNKKIPLESENGSQVFRHELYHIREKHTWDVISLETVRMLFWINPFFHVICKEIKVIHEFLADKFAANKNEEWNYAELLLMQLLGTPNHRLVNPFFHNQIKRRIAMITSSQKTSYQYLRKLLILPIAAVITILFAFKYKAAESTFYLEKTITVVIDAGHGNGTGSIAADGTRESDLTLALAKRVKALNKNDRINILLTRESEQDVDLKSRGNFTNANKADLFISVHTNYGQSAKESGFEVFVPRKNKKYYSENQILGNIFLNYFMNIYKTDNEIKQREEGIWVLDQSDCPAILVECGYLSNKNDLTYVKNVVNQDRIAGSILQSIEQFAIQRELPNFEEKKKQVADTIKPVVKVFRENDGTVACTLNGSRVSNVVVSDYEDYVGFIFVDSSKITIMKKIDVNLFLRDEPLWSEFVSTHRTMEERQGPREKTKSTQEDNKIFEKVEVEAMFPGGDGGFAKYLERNLNRKVGIENKAPEGDYSVVIQFIVNKDGSIHGVKPLTKHGYGMETEAARIIRKGPNWTAATQNGRKVASYRKQRFEFVVAYTNATAR
jgi:N-acetylmuramoyl-L-alanine amidase